MAPAPTPIGILITVALLALSGIYGVWTAISEQSWILAVAATVAIVACVGTAMLKAWSQYLVYVLTATVIGIWAYSVYTAAMVGYFGLYSVKQIVAQLLPGVVLIVLSCICAFLVFRHFRAAKPKA